MDLDDVGGMEITLESSADPASVVRPNTRQRSRITNGSALLPGVDGRSPWVRRCKDIIASHLSDLGGIDNTSAAERSIVRRAATPAVELERLEAKFAQADEAQLQLGRLHDWQFRRLRSFENFSGIGAGQSPRVRNACSVAHRSWRA
jgi:hypothetical protein